MRRAARIDENQPAIVRTLIACGCEVQSLAAVGAGVADLLVFHVPTSRLMLFEVKDGSKPPSERRLTPAQVEWHKRFPVTVIESIEDAMNALNPMEWG